MSKKILSNISYLKWTGTLFGILGASLVAFNLSDLSKYGFILFLVSSILWIIVSIITYERQLLVLNIVYSFINVLGIVRWFL